MDITKNIYGIAKIYDFRQKVQYNLAKDDTIFHKLTFGQT